MASPCRGASIVSRTARTATPSPWSITRTPREFTPRESSSAGRMGERATRVKTTGGLMCRERLSTHRGNSFRGMPRLRITRGMSRTWSRDIGCSSPTPMDLVPSRRSTGMAPVSTSSRRPCLRVHQRRGCFSNPCNSLMKRGSRFAIGLITRPDMGRNGGSRPRRLRAR